jgi:hypothetical protein
VTAIADLLKDRVGFVTGFKVKPKRYGRSGDEAFPSTIVFTVETQNDAKLLELLGKIQRDADSVNFGLEPSQTELDFASDDDDE